MSKKTGNLSQIKLWRLSKGFGILETLLASGVLIMVVSAAVYLGNLSVRNSVVASERTAAYNLAQEAAEAVRQIRDTNWINGDRWDDWKQPGAADLTGHLRPVLVGNNWYLENGDETGLGVPAIFTRYIEISSVTGSTLANCGDTGQNCKKVKVTVYWDVRGRQMQVTTESYLTNWKTL